MGNGFPPGDLGDPQVQPVRHTCDASSIAALKKSSPACRRQVVAKSEGNYLPACRCSLKKRNSFLPCAWRLPQVPCERVIFSLDWNASGWLSRAQHSAAVYFCWTAVLPAVAVLPTFVGLIKYRWDAEGLRLGPLLYECFITGKAEPREQVDKKTSEIQ